MFALLFFYLMVLVTKLIFLICVVSVVLCTHFPCVLPRISALVFNSWSFRIDACPYSLFLVPYLLVFVAFGANSQANNKTKIVVSVLVLLSIFQRPILIAFTHSYRCPLSLSPYTLSPPKKSVPHVLEYVS